MPRLLDFSLTRAFLLQRVLPQRPEAPPSLLSPSWHSPMSIASHSFPAAHLWQQPVAAAPPSGPGSQLQPHLIPREAMGILRRQRDSDREQSFQCSSWQWYAWSACPPACGAHRRRPAVLLLPRSLRCLILSLQPTALTAGFTQLSPLLSQMDWSMRLLVRFPLRDCPPPILHILSFLPSSDSAMVLSTQSPGSRHYARWTTTISRMRPGPAGRRGILPYSRSRPD